MSSSTDVSEWAAAQWGLHPNSLLNRDLEEVMVHPDDPSGLAPSAELWVQTDPAAIDKSILKFRDPTTGGWSDLSSAGGEEHEVFIQDTDPLPTDPLAELWYTPKQAAPITPPALWDVAITYNAGDYCLWPDPTHWQANKTTTGEEPGTTPPASGGGIQFGAGGLVASTANLALGTTFEFVISTGGALGTTGALLVIYNRLTVEINGTDLLIQLTTTGSGFQDLVVPLVDITDQQWIKGVVLANELQLQCSADGVTWTTVGTLTGPGDLNGGVGNQTNIGFDGTTSWYDGRLDSVETFAVAGGVPTVVQSWVSATQPGPTGGGASPKTAEVYTVQGTLVDVGGPAAGVPAWDSVPAPTASGGILRANVAGVWEDVASGVSTPPVEEVVVSPDDPLAAFPGVELWVDTDEDTPPPPNPDEVWIGNDPPTDPSVELWYDADAPADVGTVSDEVYVGPDDPDVAFPGSGIELWYDTTTDPGVLKAKVAGQWATTVADPELPLGGAVGQMLTKKTVTDGDVQWSNQPPSGLKAQDGLAITSGALYQITTMGSNGDHMFHLTATVRSGDSVQMFEVGAHAAIGGSGLAQIGLLGNWASGTKMFDRAGVHWEATGARLMLRAAWTGSLSIGWRLEDLLNANPNAGNATWTAFDPSGNEIAGVAL